MTRELQVAPGNLDAIDRHMADRINLDDPGAVLAVSHGGDTVISKAYGLADMERPRPLEIHSALDAGSIIKTLTGLAISMLEDGGTLSCETRLCDVLPEFPVYGDELQLKHLIHHESGLRNYTVLLYYMAGWHEQYPPSSDQVYDSIRRSGSLSFHPGKRYEYCDSNYFLLAKVIERVAGERFGAFIEERILSPLGMTDSTILDCPDPNTETWAEGYVGYPSELRSPHEYRTSEKSPEDFHPVRLCYTHVGAEGLRTSARDLLTLGRHLFVHSDVLSEAVRERVLKTSRIREDGFGYGYGLNVGLYRGMRFLGHSGEIQGFTATMSCFPDQDLTIACLTNRQDIAAWTCRNWVLDELLGTSPAQLQESVPRVALPAEQQELLGQYLDPISAGFLEISQVGSGLGISFNGGSILPLSGSGPWQADKGVKVIRRDSRHGESCPRLIIQVRYVASEYVPFTGDLGSDDFREYEGTYVCDALDSTFVVEAIVSGLRLTNQDSQRPSMDLDYSPMIRDFFWAHDPHPGLSQLQFLCKEGGISAFIYRDYDGDRREDFRFVRMPAV
ncbi:serine hydrolase domain-containing protein [Candidatus Bipolaricaulota bacterium]